MQILLDKSNPSVSHITETVMLIGLPDCGSLIFLGKFLQEKLFSQSRSLMAVFSLASQRPRGRNDMEIYATETE